MAASTEAYEIKLRPLLDRGALGVLLCKGNSEIFFTGNVSYKHILQAVASSIVWVEDKIRKEYSDEFAQRGVKLSFDGIDLCLMSFSIMNLKIYLAAREDLTLTCVFLNNPPASNELVSLLFDLVHVELVSEEELIKREGLRHLKALVLSARKSISSSTREELLRNLENICEFLERLRDRTLEPFLLSIRRMLSILKQKTELTDEIKLRLRRVLLLLLKNMSKILEKKASDQNYGE